MNYKIYYCTITFILNFLFSYCFFFNLYNIVHILAYFDRTHNLLLIQERTLQKYIINVIDIFYSKKKSL